MISTSGITGAGLKKCRPITHSGRSVAAANRMIGMDAMLLESSASGRTILSRAAKISVFASKSSTTAAHHQVAAGQLFQSVGEADALRNVVALLDGEFRLAHRCVQ